ncbi:hypothetical protein OFO03_04680 [Campylobacter sp. JMF_02 ED1]|uniref:hypothetical protein n=1 Tax=unclassified Campylobacter TaxID=2593542 RepID=UPI0022EA019E|nr:MULTISPECIES: hypothetical protein [unclassified Campylobacter]MDA3049386.1 hypothetical protein [Campylobacter sp. JMF_15 NE4]MDA3051186.1 hypothetical protein [Campylobacter sp. JMF_02 ED1]
MNKIYFIATICFVFFGCANPFNNKFLFEYNNRFLSKCGGKYFSQITINEKTLYKLKEYKKVYIKQNSDFKIASNDLSFIGIAKIIPIQTCDDIWCKIYYPCGDTEYFVKKGDLEIPTYIRITKDTWNKDDIQKIIENDKFLGLRND